MTFKPHIDIEKLGSDENKSTVKCKECGVEVVELWDRKKGLCLDCSRKKHTDEFGRSARYG